MRFLARPMAYGGCRRLCPWVALFSLQVLTGCGSADSAKTTIPPVRDIWEITRLQGSPAGYTHTTIRPEQRGGTPLLRIDCLSRLAVKRFGQDFEAETRFSSLESSDGQLVEFESELPQGESPLKTVGRVDGDSLVLSSTTPGKTQTRTIPWLSSYGGPYAVPLQLERQPMKPGESREIQSFDAGLGELVSTRLVARDYESVDMPGGPVKLLAIEVTTAFAGQSLPGMLWVTTGGEVLKQRMDALGVESFRATKEQALAASPEAKFDLGSDVAVAVTKRLTAPHQTQRIRYRVSLEGDDPSSAFAAGPTQAVRPVDAHTAEITVYALHGEPTGGNRAAADDPPKDADIEPNSLIESDNPEIRRLAAQAAGQNENTWQRAVALERYVHDYIKQVDFSQAFASAAEVAVSRTGDCTEHAVLLAALGRAAGIPSRVAVGLVYYDHSFAYHMWTEMHIDGRWLPLDGTLGEGGIGAAHIKLTNSNLNEAAPYSSFVPVLQIIGRLKIEIEEVDPPQ